MKKRDRHRRRTDWLPAGEHDEPLARLASELVHRALDARFWRMVITAATVAVMVTLLVSLPLTVLENHSVDQAAMARAAHNCYLTSTIAAVLGDGHPHGAKGDPLRRGGLVSTDARLRRSQILTQRQIGRLQPGALKALFTDSEVTRLQRKNIQNDLSTTRYWQQVLIPALVNAAHADCADDAG